MDTQKNNEWHGRIEVTGVADQPLMGEGTIQQILTRMLPALRNLTPRLDASGAKEVVLRFRNCAFPADAASTSEPEWMKEAREIGLFTDAIQMTPEMQAEIDAAKKPWTDDADFKSLWRIMATQASYDRAIPSEIKTLQDTLRGRYGSTPDLEYDIRDRRK